MCIRDRSLYIRLKMSESPLFARLKSEGRVSKNPLVESFVHAKNRRLVMIALFGATAGQGVVWYTGQFYALTFLQKPLNLHWTLAYTIVSTALVLGTPFILYFGWLSDRIGRKGIMLTGCALAALTYVPLYAGMKRLANPDLVASVTTLPSTAMIGLILIVFVQMVYVAMVYGLSLIHI